jgi:nucleoside-diphosphate-sugar epimerase
MSTESRVVVIGCSGAVGSRLISILHGRGYEVLGVRSKEKCLARNHICTSINLLDPRVSLKFEDFRPNSLVLTSWITTPIAFWESKMNEDWVEASKRIILQFLELGGEYVVATGTCAEYDWNLNRPLGEIDKPNPSTLYGRSKLNLLNWIAELGVPYLWTRTFAQFGLREPSGRLVPSVIDALLGNHPALISNTHGVRDFIFVEDIARILSILMADTRVGVVNLGTGVGTEIGELALRIGNMIGRPDLINITENSTERNMVVADAKKLNGLLGPYSWTSLEDALSRSIEARSQKFYSD